MEAGLASMAGENGGEAQTAAATKKRARVEREERRRIVEQNYSRIGHASDRNIHLWLPLFPDEATLAQVYGAVAGYEKRTKRCLCVDHPLPLGFKSGFDQRRERRLDRYAETWD